MKYLFHRVSALLLAVLLLLSVVPLPAGAADEADPDPACTLGTFSGDMLAGGGRTVRTDSGTFYVSEGDGYIYNTIQGSRPIYKKPAARLNYADGILYFARVHDDGFDLVSYNVVTGQERVWLEGFSGEPGPLYLVNGEKLVFQSGSAIWELELKGGNSRLICFARNLWSFVPTGCGLIFAVGSLFDYSLYAGSVLLAEHVEEYYVDFDLGRGALVYTQDGLEYQLDLTAVFKGEVAPVAFQGYTPVSAEGEDGFEVRSPLSEDEKMQQEAEAAEAMARQEADLFGNEDNPIPELDPPVDNTVPEEEPTDPADLINDPEAPEPEPEPTEPEPEPTEPEPEPTEPEPEPTEPEPTEPEPEPTEPEPEPTEPEPEPTEPEPVPTEPEPVPTEPEPEPTEPEPVPTEPEPVPTEPEPVPTEPESVPTEPEPVPTEPEPEEPTPATPSTRPGTQVDTGLPFTIYQPASPDAASADTDGAIRRPLSEGAQNVVKRAHQMLDVQWTPRKNVGGWGYTDSSYSLKILYKAGVTYTGLPYGQPVDACYVPWSATLSQFVAFVNWDGSKMYTSRSSYGRGGPYYATDCTGFVSWAWDLPHRCYTGNITGYGNLISNPTYSVVQVGDMFCSSGHAMLVTDITYNEAGAITGIQISHANPTTEHNGCCYSTWYTGNNVVRVNNYFNQGYKLYRHKNLAGVSYNHDCAVPLDGDECPLCGAGMFLKPGVDVSQWQGAIDWQTAASYLDFAIIRVGYGYRDDNGNLLIGTDTQYLNNVKGCENNDLPYGIYYYARAVNQFEAMQEADFVMGILMELYQQYGYIPDLPIFYDVEDANGNLALSNDELLLVVRTFCETLESFGYKAGVYASANPWNNKLTSSVYNNWARWVAQHASTSLNANGGANIWQYTDGGHVPGISTNVDMNYWLGTLGSIEHRYKTEVTEPTCTENGIRGYICVACGREVAETLDALGHQFVDGVCSRCGRVMTIFDRFEDLIPGKWYVQAIEYVVEHGLFAGVSETQFAPDAVMNRAMMMTVLWSMAGKPEANSSEQLFSDVSPKSYYAKAVAWASQYAISSGTSLTTFSPLQSVTREQVAVFLLQFARYKGYELAEGADLSVYPDVEDVSDYAQEAMAWAVAEGLISGVGSGDETFLMPKSGATRAQVATILMRFQQIFEAEAQQTELPENEPEPEIVDIPGRII